MGDREKTTVKTAKADDKALEYAGILRQMIRLETVSAGCDEGDAKFHEFRKLLKKLFPRLFETGEYREFKNGFLLKWEGRDSKKEPVLLMNHHDVVEAKGDWLHEPFSGEIADGKLWGRGTLDNKGGLFAMLQAAEELVNEGFIPESTIWFFSASTEETTGAGADEASRWFKKEGIRLRMCFDEGGFIVNDPLPGVKGRFAMIGVGEKGCADIKFIAKSGGGHASMPEKDTPLVRLGKFMAAADSHRIFPAKLHPAVCGMLKGFAPFMGSAGKLMEEPERHRTILTKLIVSMSPKAAALLRTTIAFTMAKGSDGTNVLPTEAYVIANMRYSHHQGQKKSFEAVRKLASKYDLETEILDPGYPSAMTDYRKEAYSLAKDSVEAVFPDATPVPYLMTGASDARFFDRVCDQCIRFLPFFADDDQLASIHGLNENVDIASLAPAVDFYRHLIRNA